jgi:hypothetical protein
MSALALNGVTLFVVNNIKLVGLVASAPLGLWLVVATQS